MAEKVLVATDLSDAADEAILQAHREAEAEGAELVVCHVIPALPPTHPLFPQIYEEDAEAMMNLQMSALALVRERVSCVTGRPADGFDVTVDIGSPETAVLEAVEQVRPSLLVVGSYGTTNMPRLFLGSVAQRVVKSAPCAVLVTRRADSNGPVVVATDLSESLSRLLAVAKKEATRREARLTILHSLDLLPPPVMTMLGRRSPSYRAKVDRVKDEARAKLAGASRELMVADGADIVITEGPPAGDILRTVVEQCAALVVVGRCRATGVAKLGMGRVAEDVVRAAPCSVLVVPV